MRQRRNHPAQHVLLQEHEHAEQQRQEDAVPEGPREHDAFLALQVRRRNARRVSLFAYQLGMNFIAAQGPMGLQAQSGPMSLASLRDLTISSTDGKVIITAAKEVWIGAGGSYIQINGSGIVNGSPGPILEKGTSWDVLKPDSKIIAAPFSPDSGDEEIIEQSFSLLKDGVTPVEGFNYDLYSDGELHTQRGKYSEGETVTVPGQVMLKFVTWMARDSAQKDE